jgi:ribosomal protein S6--L-glutamate ligase
MNIGILSSAEKKGSEYYRYDERLIGEIEASGNEARVINHEKTYVGITEEGRVLYDSSDLTPINVDAVIPRLGRNVDMGLIVLKLLESQGVFTTSSSESIPRARNKLTTNIFLDKAGIPTPYSISPTGSNPKNLRDAFRMIQPDPKKEVIIKNLTGSHGKGVRTGESLKSAVSIADGMERRYMIQEFIGSPEPDIFASDIRLIVVDGNVVASMIRRCVEKDEFRSNLAQGAKAESYEPTPREVELALRATAALGLGVSGVDILLSTRGPLVNEVNTNPGFGIETYTQVNVAKSIIDFVIRNATEPITHQINN